MSTLRSFAWLPEDIRTIRAAWDPDQPRDDNGQWGDGGGDSSLHSEPEITKEAGLDAVTELADGKTSISTTEDNGLFDSSNETVRGEMKAVAVSTVPDARKAGFVKTVDGYKLDPPPIALQDDVDVKNLKIFVRNPGASKGSEDEVPTIVKWEGHRAVFDGHHRIAAMRIRGVKKAKVEVVDLDAFMNSADYDPMKYMRALGDPDQPRDKDGQWTTGDDERTPQIVHHDDGKFSVRMVDKQGRPVGGRIGGYKSIEKAREALIKGGFSAESIQEVHLPKKKPRNANDPDQPRDENGQWTSSGSGESGDGGRSTLAGVVASVDVSDGPVVIGAVNTTAYRVGALDQDEHYFAESKESADQYASLHAGHETVKYRVETKNTIVAKHHAQLYAFVNPGKTIQDAIHSEEKKSKFKITSVEAWRKVQGQLMAKVQKMGYDSVIFTKPPAPAVHELVVFGKSKGHKITALQGMRSAGDPDQPRDENGQWTSDGGNESFGTGSPRQKVARLREKYGDSIPTNKIFAHTTELGHVKGLSDAYDHELLNDTGTPTKVKTRDLIPVQDAVDAAGLDHYVHGTGNFQGDRPDVVLFKGKHYVMDGTHRSAVAILHGAHEIDVTLYDADKKKPRNAADNIGGFAFDATNPAARKWIEEHALETVDDMSTTTRERVRDLLERSFDGEFDIDELTDEIGDIIGDDARAESIARTETMTASNAGQQQLWDQAVEEGLLTGDEQQEWIVTPDDLLCPICAPMEGQKAPLDGTFEVDGEDIDGPPAHPRCRCTIGLTV